MRNFPYSLRWMLAGVVVLAIGVAAWLKVGWMQNPTLQVAGLEVAAHEDVKTDSGVTELVERADEGGTEDSRVELEVRLPAVPSRPERSARPGDLRVWRGSVEYVGLDPELAASTDFSLGQPELHLLFIGVGGEQERVATVLERLGWSCVLPFMPEDIASVEVVGVVRRERLWHSVDGSATLPLDFTTEPVIRLELAPVTTISVVDAKTREPIQRFRLGAEGGGASTGQGALTRDEGLKFSTRRLELHPYDEWNVLPGESGTLIVSADGYADAAVDVAIGSGIAHEVRLARGGSVLLRWELDSNAPSVWFVDRAGTLKLAVERIEAAEAEHASQRIRSEVLNWDEIEPELSFADEESRLHELELEKLVEGLVPGKYHAALTHVSSGFLGVTRLAEAQFDVRAGRRPEVRLLNVVDTQAVNVPLELEFATSVGVGPPQGERVRLCRSNEDDWGTAEPLALVDGTWRTQAVLVRPGKFRVSVRGLRTFEHEFEFPPNSPSLVVLPVPALQHFRVSLAPISGGAVTAKERLRWSSADGSGEQDAQRVAGAPGTSEFYTDRVPVKVLLSSSSKFQLLAGSSLELVRGGEHQLRCIEKPRVRLRFRNGVDDATVPFHLDVRFTKSPPGAWHALQDRVRALNELHVWFPEPGQYELTFQQLKDFEPLPPLRVNIGARHDQLIELPLVPKR